MTELDYEQKIKELEKANRILQKKLERSENNRILLEKSNEKKENLFLNVINELRESQKTLEERSYDLEQALKKLQAMQSKLVESEKMSALGLLVAGIAHEINNPVNFIHGNLQYAAEYAHDILDLLQCYQETSCSSHQVIAKKIKINDFDFIREDFIRLMKSMEYGTQRIQEIVQSLRTFSHLDEAEFKAVDIHEGINSTLMILQSRLKSQPNRPEITVIQEYGSIPLIECYAGKLNQVFLNIITNAIDALEQKLDNEQKFYQKPGIDCLQSTFYSSHFIPKIHIITELVDSWIKIYISDNGWGMDKEVTQQIFNAFFTTKPVGKGMGLGLFISYQIIVENHQGKLEYNSTPGIGTEFVIMIPRQLRGNL